MSESHRLFGSTMIFRGGLTTCGAVIADLSGEYEWEWEWLRWERTDEMRVGVLYTYLWRYLRGYCVVCRWNVLVGFHCNWSGWL